LRVEHGAAFVSVVGLGLGAREAAQAEGALERSSVPLIALRVSPTALVFRVPNKRVEDAVRALHAALIESGE
jgi:aspartokinase